MSRQDHLYLKWSAFYSGNTTPYNLHWNGNILAENSNYFLLMLYSHRSKTQNRSCVQTNDFNLYIKYPCLQNLLTVIRFCRASMMGLECFHSFWFNPFLFRDEYRESLPFFRLQNHHRYSLCFNFQNALYWFRHFQVCGNFLGSSSDSDGIRQAESAQWIVKAEKFSDRVDNYLQSHPPSPSPR